MAETEANEKVALGSLGTKLDTKLVEYDKTLRELAKKHGVPLEVYRKLLEKSVKQAMRNFQIGDLHSAGHILPPRLQAERDKRDRAAEAAKETKKNNLILHLDAAKDSQSLQFIYRLQAAVPTETEIAAWNKGVQKLSATLAKILRKTKTKDGPKEYSTRRLQHNIADIQIFDGWGIYDKLAMKIMEDAMKVVHVKPGDAPIETDQDDLDLEAGDTKANQKTGETASTAQAEPPPQIRDEPKKKIGFFGRNDNG